MSKPADDRAGRDRSHTDDPLGALQADADSRACEPITLAQATSRMEGRQPRPVLKVEDRRRDRRFALRHHLEAETGGDANASFSRIEQYRA
jgi:hypothetical protein